MKEVCGWVSQWSLEASFPLRIEDGGSLWVGVTVELGSSVSFNDRRWCTVENPRCYLQQHTQKKKKIPTTKCSWWWWCWSCSFGFGSDPHCVSATL
nr:hypothetical protein CFP56_19713 [Quercus suber]